MTNEKMHTCRLCLAKDAKHNIFKHGSNVHDEIMFHCKLQVYKNDGLPQYMCKKCFKKLNSILEFIQKCEESDKILRAKLILLTEVKTEDLKSEPDLEKCDNRLAHLDHNYDDDCADDDKPIKEYLQRSLLFPENVCKNKDKEKKVISNLQNSIEIDDNVLKLNEQKNDYIKFASVKIYINKSDPHPENEKSQINKANKDERKNSVNTSQLCPVCGKYFPKANSFRSHMKIHDGDSFKCDECSKSFSTKVLLKNHQKRHLNLRGFLCKICGKTFTTNTSSKRHMEVVHQKLKLVPCKLCNKTLSTPRALREHIKIHTGVKNYECEICNKRFTYKISLTFHTRVHTGEKPFACKFCDSKFAVQKTLKDHERLHTGEKPYVCPVCNKGFMQGSNMKSHFRNNHKGMELPRKKSPE